MGEEELEAARNQLRMSHDALLECKADEGSSCIVAEYQGDTCLLLRSNSFHHLQDLQLHQKSNLTPRANCNAGCASNLLLHCDLPAANQNEIKNICFLCLVAKKWKTLGLGQGTLLHFLRYLVV